MGIRFANQFIVILSITMAFLGLALGYRGDAASIMAAACLLIGGFMLFLLKHRLDDAKLQVNRLAKQLGKQS